jgi:glycosyltransferase involved in cell wall biosynthesis
LPDLAQLCDLRVIRLSGQPISEELVDRWSPRPAVEIGAKGRLPLYQMGNNPYHDEVLDLALAVPGVVTLHDLFLHHLLMERTLARRRFPPYKKQLEHDHGWMGAAVAMPPRWGGYGDAGVFTLPCNRTLAQSQRGMLVHSRWGSDLLRDCAGDIAVRVIPMPMPLSDKPDGAAVGSLKERLGIPFEAPVLGSFGFQTPIKRTDVVVRALALPGLEKAHLLVVGEAAPQLDIDTEARKAGVRDRVHILGFVDRKELAAAMAAADLCVNLRYPTAGETSASLLRLLAQGRPAIVSDYAQFADFSSEIVIKVPIGEGEAEALAARAGEALGDRQHLTAMGERARDMIRRDHDPAKAAKAVRDACSELADLEPPERTPATPPPPTTLTWGSIEGSIAVEGLEEPWAEGSRRTLRIRLKNRGRARWLAGERGNGGVVLEMKLEAGGHNHLESQPWPPLPLDLHQDEEATIEVAMRRPLGDCTLKIEPHILGNAGFSALSGPVFEQVV